MIELIQDLPGGVDGLDATGTVSREDYQRVVDPLLERAHREGRRVRLLYRFSADFQGFSAGAAWEDMRVGIHYLRLIDRAAVVTDHGWLRDGVRLAGAFLPCALRVFAVDDEAEAIQWLGDPEAGSRITHRLIPESGVLVLEPHGKLRQEDFDAIALTVDPWVESYGELSGLVLHARGVPGWESLGALIRHLRFVREHHTKVRRLAIVMDGKAPELAPRLLQHLIHAEPRHFSGDKLAEAIAWAGEASA